LEAIFSNRSDHQYIILMLPIAIIGDAIETSTWIILMSMAQFGYQLATTTMDGFVPWITPRELQERKGQFHTIK
jgi:hypothetical protein